MDAKTAKFCRKSDLLRTILVLPIICYTVAPLLQQAAFGKYAQEHFTRFWQDLNLSAPQKERLDAIEKKYAAEQARVDQKLRELGVEQANPREDSFYLHYGQQAAVHGSYFEHNPDAYLKACRSAYFRHQQSALFKELGAASTEKRSKTMELLNPEQRAKWIEFHRDLQNK